MPDLPLAERDHAILYGYYGCGNFGDDLLLLATVTGLRRIFPGYGFLVRDHGLPARIEGVDADVTMTGIETILAARPRRRLLRWRAYFAAWWNLFGRARWLIFGGGTLFHARPSLNALLVQWMLCAMARLRGVRIFALGVGVSELSPAARTVLRRIIALSDLFLVRDEAALAQCVSSKAQLGGELAFGIAEFRQPHPRDRGDAVGLTVYPPACGQASVIEVLRQTVRLLRERGRRVIFLVSQRSGVVDDDVAVFAQIASDVEIRTLRPNPLALARTLDGLAVICGMRYHAMVVGAMAGFSFAGVAHDNKIAELCRQFEMPCVAPSEFTANGFVAAIEDAARRAPDRSVLDAAAAAAADNFLRLAEFLA